MSDGTWGPWIDGSIPPPIGSFIQMRAVDKNGRGDMTHEAIVVGYLGDHVDISPLLPVSRQWELDCYRIRKPRGLTLLEGLLENLPERVTA